MTRPGNVIIIIITKGVTSTLTLLENMQVTVILIITGVQRTVRKGFVKRLEKLENRKTSPDHPNYSITQISQNTEKSSGDLIGFPVTDFSERLSANACVKNSQGVI